MKSLAAQCAKWCAVRCAALSVVYVVVPKKKWVVKSVYFVVCCIVFCGLCVVRVEHCVVV